MKRSNLLVLRLCLTGGVLIASAGVSHAQNAGVARIAKPRSAGASSSVQPASFVDLADDASDNLTQFYDTLYGATLNSQRETRARFAGFGRAKGDEYVCDDCQFDGGMGDSPHCRSKGLRHGFGRHCRGGGYCPIGANGHDGCHGCHGMLYYFHCKFGFLTPTGNGGAGSPFHGKYSRVYPQDVYYFDQRDSQLYAAQGYGVPMAVPLAPTVGHAYNYSWGVPASRLTPISNVAPR